ncbi:MAG: DUF1631 family protein [Lysobacter sp.]
MSAQQPLGVNATHTNPVSVLEDIKRLALEQLGALPGGLYRPIEEALQSLEASAESMQDQAALLVLRQHSASYVMRFRQQIGLGFDDFRGLRPRNDRAELGLVEERLLDFHFAGQRLGVILDQRYQQPLEEMGERLKALAEGLRTAPGLNPVAPSRLVTAFIEAIGDADLPNALGGLLFDQYQQELVGVLDDLYDRINALLAGAGYDTVDGARRTLPRQVATRSPFNDNDQVEPRFAPGMAPSMPPAPAEHAAAAYAPAAYAPPAQHASPNHRPSEHTGAWSSTELAGLREQLHAWRNDVPRDEVVSKHGVPQRRLAPRRELQVKEVLTIASLLQAESPDVYARALATSGRLAEAIRSHLTEGARRLGLTPDQTCFSVDEEDAIDLVAMLFEGLFRTHSLQDRARRLYARLVLPYVKVALHNDAMFVQAAHPARRLLDAITEACEGNEAATAQDRELLERAAAVSQRVVAEFNEDLAVFELAHAELEQLLQQQRRRIELQEDRAAKATHGRERLADARAQADQIVQRRLAARPLTPAVADFLITPWRHHLVQTLLRDGDDSARHAEAARLGDSLVEADRLAEIGHGSELADCLIAQEAAIVQCLATSGLDDSASRHGMASLVGALANPSCERVLHALPPRSADESGDDGARLWLAGGTDTVPHDPEVAASMRRLQPGEWLHMIGAQGEATAVKVAWISPLTSRLLLVNRRGLRVLVGSPEELAELVGAGRLVVGAEKTPFDEAMRQMRDRLDQAVGQRSVA